MIPKSNRANTLRAERERLIGDAFRSPEGGDPRRYDGRIAFIDRELAKLARRAERGRVYRETMYDLNGHHGRA
jgi:hypothetical protein